MGNKPIRDNIEEPLINNEINEANEAGYVVNDDKRILVLKQPGSISKEQSDITPRTFVKKQVNNMIDDRDSIGGMKDRMDSWSRAEHNEEFFNKRKQNKKKKCCSCFCCKK
eukprot:309217_1